MTCSGWIVFGAGWVVGVPVGILLVEIVIRLTRHCAWAPWRR